MRNFFKLTCFALLLAIFGCNNAEQANYERAQDPWVFRSVLDEQPRMLTLALNDNLWAAYHASDGSLYKVWKGTVNLDGAVYTTVHGPQPSTLGDAYILNDVENTWTVDMGGNKETPKVQYKGHRLEKGQVYILYNLLLANGETIQVTERPEYVEKETGQVGFERVFTTAGVPSGANVLFSSKINSIASQRNVETDGELEVLSSEEVEAKGLNAISMTAQLKLNSNAETKLSVFFTKKPLIENPNKVADNQEEEEELPLGQRLINRSDCKSCHNTFVKTIGPSYKDVAKRYRKTEENIAMLVGKVKNGGAGVWGEAAMSAHADLPDTDIRAMIDYIMDLDAEEEAEIVKMEQETAPEDLDLIGAAEGLEEGDLFPEALLKVFFSEKTLTKLADINFDGTPVFQGTVPKMYADANDLKGLPDNFAIEASGYLKIPKDNNYVFRLESDDGSRFWIGDVEVIDHDGLHGASPKDGEIALSAGYHPFKLQFFQGAGGKHLALKWRAFNAGEFTLVPETAFVHDKKDKPVEGATFALGKERSIPGDAAALEEVHPSYDLSQARPDDFLPKVGGMDFLSDGRMVVSTWDAEGAVYIVDGVQGGDPAKMSTKKIAQGLAEPLGLKVVDDEIYVLQKQELTKLIDLNGDEIIDEYQTVCNSWRVSANFHEFAFGLAYKDGYFYGALAIAILPGGASANPQIPDRGKAIRISKETGEMEIIAEGLRTPNGIGIGADGEIFIADNQGDWLPSSKILHVNEGDFFGSRAVDSARVAQLPVKLPVVWLPQDEIGNSPTTPSYLNDGPYKGQMIHGEVTNGGVKRVFVEKVDGNYQGAVFRFIQGLESGVNRLVWGPDGALYIGGVGSTGNWRHNGKLWYGLQRLKYNEQSTFEMLAVRAKSNGVEIELTEPLAEGEGWDASAYTVQQWYYLPTHEYGGPKIDLEDLDISSVNISEDRKKIFLELEGMKENHVVYIRLPYYWNSESGQEIWSTEAWYTMNKIPQNQPGFSRYAPGNLADNTLTEREKAAGWKLLFDGETMNGWRTFRKDKPGSSWVVQDGAIMLDSKPSPDGHWQAPDGGDIITEEEYENYELSLEWKISSCGNSGIIYNVLESDEYDYVWHTGPEMQILDNTCHPDAKIVTHRAGDLYDMIECKYNNVNPAGQWNSIRLIVNNGKVEQWLNGRKLVEFEMFTDEWNEMIANSKFKDMKDFGQARKGHIALQDHGDKVWFRNIKIRELGKESI